MADDLLVQVLDELPMGVWVARAPSGEVAYVNRAFQEILGMSAVAESQIEDAPRTYGIFDRRGNPFPVERLPFSQVLATGATAVVDDLVIHRPDRTRVNVRAVGQPVKDADGALTHVIVAFIDITREVVAEVQRATADAYLRLAVDHAPIALFSIDLDGIITLSEGAGLTSLGVRSGQLVGQSVFELYKDHPTIPGYIRRGLRGESFWYTVQVRDAVYDTWLTPLRDAGGKIVGALGLSNDATEVRHLQAGIIQSDRVRAVGTLAASVAHEINNPLMYVLGAFRSLDRTLEAQLAAAQNGAEQEMLGSIRADSERMRDEIATARKGIEHITTIMRDLKTFSRSDDPKLEPVDLATILDSVLKLVRKEVTARARLAVSVTAVPLVLGSEARLVQVLLNLLMNAAQSLTGGHPQQDEVSLTLRPEGERVVIEVGDSGPGVPPAERERIFEPFVTTKPIGEGTGLGLFVCRNIVRGLGGEIAVMDRPGGGALFRVSLPVAEAVERAAELPTPAASEAPAGRRVLVVEDEVLVARLMAAQLEEAGFSVEVATDSERAMETLLSDRPFDLVYCDLMMNGLTGMDIAEAVQDKAPERLAQMVFMTGGAFLPRASEFVSVHRDRCVLKPFDAAEDARRRLAASR
jgi:two-component system cell cycle sensor histidine kinase/response regulator CckA